jgi:tetratricopeptide (TPR) repeat protein
MTRRLLGACLAAAILLGVPTPRGMAKPPDLPENQKVIVTPRLHSTPGDGRMPWYEQEVNWVLWEATGGTAGAPTPPLRFGLGVNSDGDSSQPMDLEQAEVPTPTDADWFVKSITHKSRGLTYNRVSGWTLTGDEPAAEEPAAPPQKLYCSQEKAIQVVFADGNSHPPTSSEASSSACPYMHQHRPAGKKPVHLLAEPAKGRDVLTNLKLLQQADDGLERARQLARCGHILQAMECLEAVRKLCPGSSYDRRVNEVLAEILESVPQQNGSAAKAATPRKAAEPTAEKPASPRRETADERINRLMADSEDLKEIEKEFNAHWATDGNTQGPSESEANPAQPRPFTTAPDDCAMHAWLTGTVSCDYNAAPLQMVLSSLCGCRPLSIVFDEAALQDAGVNLLSPITLKLANLPVKMAIDLALKQVHLGCIICDKTLLVTSEECAAGVPSCWCVPTPVAEEKPQACCPSACPKCEEMHAKVVRKCKQVEALLAACRQALNEGEYEKAAECARKAHELAPQRVEAEAVVYRFYLFAEKQGKAGAKAEKQKQVEKLMREFNTLYKEGKYTEAEALALRAHEIDPDSKVVAAGITLVRWARSRAECEASKAAKEKMILLAEDECEVPGDTAEEREKAIERTLRKPVSLNFKETPLKQVLEDLADANGINIVIDKPALQEEGVTLESPISMKLDQVSLKSALNLILHQVHLTYVIKDEVLQITTEPHSHGGFVTMTFSVGDLVASAEFAAMLGGKPPADEALIRFLCSSTAPRSWSEQGGPGTVDYFPLTKSLVVNQTPDVQEQVSDLLEVLRRELKKRVTAAKVDDLLRACHDAIESGDHAKAAQFAAEACALDAEAAEGDPLIYKLQLLAEKCIKARCGKGAPAEDVPATVPSNQDSDRPAKGTQEQQQPDGCGKLPTMSEPALPPTDAGVVAALQEVLVEAEGQPCAGVAPAPAKSGHVEFGIDWGGVEVYGWVPLYGCDLHLRYRQDSSGSAWVAPAVEAPRK